MADNLIQSISRMLGGKPSVRVVAEDLQLTSELILLVRMMFADGEMRPEELQAFKRLCVETFGLDERDIPQILQYLKDFGYETSSFDAAAMFKDRPIEQKRTLLVNLLKMAKADNHLDMSEEELIRRTASVLGLTSADLAKTNKS
jgi:uncharacterized tellurite resistance protein B-like protein